MAPTADQPRRVVVLGSTGSVGTQTLDVIEHLNAMHEAGRFPHRWEVVGLCANSSAGVLAQQASAHPDAGLALADPTPAYRGPGTPRRGTDAALELVRETEADLVVAAMVGAAGLPATLAAAESGTDVALANKETLVVAGTLIIDAARRTGASLLPLDSEHSGVWRTLEGQLPPKAAPPVAAPESVSRVVLTASGGAFRDRTLDEVEHATPEEALAHPTWNMGAKVTIDSATMINKGLELIEAHHLFGLDNNRLGVLVHRQSAVHAFAELSDGAVIAHLSATDMRHPILAALAHPHDAPTHPAAAMDLAALSRLDFTPLDPARFPAVELARRVIAAPGTTLGATLNAANEVAVRAFLDRRVPFGEITRLVARVLDSIEPAPLEGLAHALEADAEARRVASDQINANAGA